MARNDPSVNKVFVRNLEDFWIDQHGDDDLNGLTLHPETSELNSKHSDEIANPVQLQKARWTW